MTETTQVDEREARRVAEAARETKWDRPSFAKELYLGRFRLDLVHPHPRQSPGERARTDAFLDELRALCETELDGSVIEREAIVPDEYVKALARIGTFGMKIPREYGGLGLGQVGYNHGLMLVGAVHPSLGTLVSAHQS
ncbi:MAG: acyl-CoA dehydrogenase family protein, partial [Jiangellaceae bacterium]